MIRFSEEKWELTIVAAGLDAADLGCIIAADFDGDGQEEIVTGGADALFWCRPSTGSRGCIARNVHCHVGMAAEDIDGDGLPEVVCGLEDPEAAGEWMIVSYKPEGGLEGSWKMTVLDPRLPGGPHDILFADLDDDGVRELVTAACYTATPGLFILKPAPEGQWLRYPIVEGRFNEGTAIGDLDGDGLLEVVCGPYWYHMPREGPFSGPWEAHYYAPDFREMCRALLVDITGNGRPDIVLAESEYPDGFLSWFENRIGDDTRPFVEHRLASDLVFSHSLDCLRDGDGRVRIFVAEMEQGGWNAPYNHDARLMLYTGASKGTEWEYAEIYNAGEGTHQAFFHDIDGDGEPEIVGKTWGHYFDNCKVQVWKRPAPARTGYAYRHRLLDTAKPYTATDILSADVDGDGLPEVVCGAWWYRGYRRHEIPGVNQIINACDLDGDGVVELIGIARPENPDPSAYRNLSANLVWVKPVDAAAGRWEIHVIGTGSGDWPHGSLVAPLLPGGRRALIVGYHDAAKGVLPELFEIPEDPRRSPWDRRTLADIPYGEEFVAADLNGDGVPDIVAGAYRLENNRDGTFTPHRIAPEGFQAARVAVLDVNRDGRPDVILGQEVLDFRNGVAPYSRLAWFENTGEEGPWPMHVIDTVRCAHSLSTADLDGDGVEEVICAEHDPFRPYRSRCRLMAYKPADAAALTWTRHVLDRRFEHHDGAKIMADAAGRPLIMSHGWKDSKYVHLWEPMGE